MSMSRCLQICLGCLLLGAVALQAQVDPGPRPGPPGAGPPVPTLNPNEVAFWDAGLKRFQVIDSVSGALAGEPGVGLGPTFNSNSCSSCHAQPAVGGSSPAPFSPQVPQPNPQVAVANLDGATNVVPSFITVNGPVRAARLILDSTGALDGGVHDLYTVAGRADAPGCGLAQPNFPAELANHNVIFRIPTPTFGLGFVENTPDIALQNNLSANAAAKAAMGITGRFNTNGNDGTITRFGWKAQNKSLLIFAGEAFNVEQGVANEGFPNERSAIAGCVFNPTPEDSTHILNPVGGGTTGTAGQMSSDVVTTAAFMRLNAVPIPTTSTPSELNGRALFDVPSSTGPGIGCALCHSTKLQSAKSPFTGMSNFTYQPYSDFALHHMGSTLADGVNQGIAGPDEFRTAPLWGVGQRLFFMHDGRTTDLYKAIQLHGSPTTACVKTSSAESFTVNGFPFSPSASMTFCGSEANSVLAKFNALPVPQQQDILNFLRSL